MQIPIRSQNMNLLITSAPALDVRLSSKFRLSLLTLGLTAGIVTAQAQSVFSSEPVVPNVPAAIKDTSSATDATSATASPSTPIQLGSVTFHPHLFYQILYGDGVLVRPGTPTVSTLQMIAPGLRLNLGTHWVFDYTPTQTIYSNPAFDDTLTHAISLNGGYRYGEWQFQVSQNYVTSSQSRIETGRQTDQKTYATALTASYRFGEHMALDTILNQQVLLVKNPPSTPLAARSPTTRDRFISERLNYIFSPRLRANVSVDMGYTSIDPGSDLTFTRPQVQFVWQPVQKLTFNLQGGFESRKFRSGLAQNQTTSTYNGIIADQPVESTTISFYLTRETPPSYVVNQTTQYNRWNIVLDQKVYKSITMHTGYSEEHSNYNSNADGATARADKGYLYNLRLEATLFQRVGIKALYQHRKQNSDSPGLSFAGSYVGFEIDYTY